MTDAPNDLTTIRYEPPHNDDAERRLLEGVLFSPRLYHDLAKMVRTHEMFYRQSHRHLWRAITDVVHDGRELTETGIRDQLDTNGHHDDATEAVLTHCYEAATFEDEARDAAKVVRRDYLARRALKDLATVSDQLCRKNASPEDIARELTGTVQMLQRSGGDVDESHPEEVAKRILERHESILAGDTDTGYDCGINPVDQLMQVGWEPGMNNVICAMSGHGKTTLASAICAGLAERHDAVVNYWPCEVGREYQAARMLTAIFARDDTSTLKEQRILYPNKVPPSISEQYQAEMIDAIGWWAESGIYMEAPGMINVRDVEMKARALRAEYPDRPLVVCADYLQYCHVGDWSMGKSDRISAASMRLASLAKELDAIVITLSQLTNSDSVHPIPMPSKKQVRWSQDILNDADSLLLYHRPWDTDPKRGKHAVLSRAKARFLTPAHVRLKADGSRNTFEWSENPGAMDDVEGINRTPCLNSRRYA